MRIKQLPRYEFCGRMATVPDEYAEAIGVKVNRKRTSSYSPGVDLFDYQQAIVEMAIAKKRFAVFADCGLGKTLMLLEFARHVASVQEKPVLIVSPLMVVNQTQNEAIRFYGDKMPIEVVSAKRLTSWLEGKRHHRIGITNYDALKDDTPDGNLGGLILMSLRC